MCVCVCADASELVLQALDIDALEPGLQAMEGAQLTQGHDNVQKVKNTHRIGTGGFREIHHQFPQVPCRCTYVQLLDGVHIDKGKRLAISARGVLCTRMAIPPTATAPKSVFVAALTRARASAMWTRSARS